MRLSNAPAAMQLRPKTLPQCGTTVSSREVGLFAPHANTCSAAHHILLQGGVGGGGATCCQCVHGKQKRKVGERESTTGWNTRWDGWEAAAATVSIPERKPRAVGGRRQLDSPLAETSRGQQRKQQLLRRAITAGPLTSIPIGPHGLWDGNKKKIHNIESGLTTHKNLLL